VPPSAGGFEPHLSLDYDSGGGVTDVGTGWRLSGIPTIRRRTENGLPLFTASDAMEIAGGSCPAPSAPSGSRARSCASSSRAPLVGHRRGPTL
jgi:hypothetical protein